MRCLTKVALIREKVQPIRPAPWLSVEWPERAHGTATTFFGTWHCISLMPCALFLSIFRCRGPPSPVRFEIQIKLEVNDMAHRNGYKKTGDDYLRARFTMWLNTTLIHAKLRYLETHTQKLDIVPLDDVIAETITDPIDYYAYVERSQTDFDFEEEKLARAFSELPLMRREVLRLLFVEEKTPEEIAQQLQCSVEMVYKQKSRALIKLRAALTEGADD